MISAFVSLAFVGLVIALFVGLVRLQKQMGSCDTDGDGNGCG